MYVRDFNSRKGKRNNRGFQKGPDQLGGVVNREVLPAQKRVDRLPIPIKT